MFCICTVLIYSGCIRGDSDTQLTTFTRDDITVDSLGPHLEPNYGLKSINPCDILYKHSSALATPVIAEISEVNDYCDTATSFLLSEDSNVQIYAVGEGIYGIKSSLLASHKNDNVELFFDMRNDKLAFFDRNSDDRQFHFSWNTKGIDGQNISTKGVKFEQANLSQNNYSIEVSLPWKSLGFVKPNAGVLIGFDVMIDDNDGVDLEAKVTWHSKSASLWKNTSHFGNLMLVDDEVHKLSDSVGIALAHLTSISPTIDGLRDKIWENSATYKVENFVLGTLDGQDDLSASFNVIWDEENLYLFVDVNDDIKSQANIIWDYGWIEDKEEQVVWKMEVRETNHAGGAIKNRFVDTTIFLSKGQYTLRYVSDESHAFNSWDDDPPCHSLYGIVVHKK